MMPVLSGWRIGYAAVMAQARGLSADQTKALLAEELPDRWCAVYGRKFPLSEIVEVTLDTYRYIFDLTESRVVVAYGQSGKRVGKRSDGARRQGWAGGSITGHHSVPVDKGHFMSDAAGGGADINLFVQRRDLNRGWSPEGRVYKEMETFCQKNAGTFCFSRGLYRGSEQDPAALEFGVLRSPTSFRVEVFDNSLT